MDRSKLERCITAVLLYPDQKRRLMYAAAARDVRLSAMVRAIVDDWLAAQVAHNVYRVRTKVA
jgi:hypothetical protein